MKNTNNLQQETEICRMTLLQSAEKICMSGVSPLPAIGHTKLLNNMWNIQ